MYEVTIDKETGLPVMDNSFARVVRCKDCIHYKYENHLIGTPTDPPYGFCGTINRYIPETFYCAYGERREDV